jgi:hypothetical protein
VTILHQKQENIVSYVFGNLMRPAHLQGESVDATVPAPVKLRERFLISGQHQAEEFRIS